MCVCVCVRACEEYTLYTVTLHIRTYGKVLKLDVVGQVATTYIHTVHRMVGSHTNCSFSSVNDFT